MKKSITFTLPAEAVQGATGAFLLGDFNNWNPENAPRLEKQPDGSYQTTARLEEGKTYQYRFLLDDGRWVNDYHAQKYVPVSGLYVDNCVITVPVSDTEAKKTSEPAEPANTKVVNAPDADAEPSVDQKTTKTKKTKKTTGKTAAPKTSEPKTKRTKAGGSKPVNEKRAKAGKKEDNDKEKE